MMHKDQSGKSSMMRVGFAFTLIIGGLMCIAGIVAVFMKLDADTLLTGGSLMITGSGFAKSIQKKFEGTQ